MSRKRIWKQQFAIREGIDEDMNGDEPSFLPQASQQSSADANTLYAPQHPAPLSATPSQPRILLPGQEAVTPATYSDQTMPLSINPSPANVSTLPAFPPSSSKAEPIGASILYPPIPASYPNSAQVPPIALHSQKHTRFSRNTWLLILPIGIALIAIVLGLLVIPVSASWLPQIAAKTAPKSVASQPTSAVPTLIPTSVPTPVPTPTAMDANAASANGVTVTPNSFDIQNDCQPDNEYRCTITLALSSDANNAVSWSASLNGVDHDFHPRRGRLEPGQQQQIIVYLYETCPIDAEFDVAMKHQHLNVPLRCN